MGKVSDGKGAPSAIQVTIVEGKELRNMTTFSIQDPYVRCHLGSNKKKEPWEKTAVRQNAGTSATWDEKLVMAYKGEEDIVIQAMHNNEMIGQNIFKLREVMHDSDRSWSGWIELNDGRKNKFCGRLKVNVKCLGYDSKMASPVTNNKAPMPVAAAKAHQPDPAALHTQAPPQPPAPAPAYPYPTPYPPQAPQFAPAAQPPPYGAPGYPPYPPYPPQPAYPPHAHGYPPQAPYPPHSAPPGYPGYPQAPYGYSPPAAPAYHGGPPPPGYQATQPPAGYHVHGQRPMVAPYAGNPHNQRQPGTLEAMAVAAMQRKQHRRRSSCKSHKKKYVNLYVGGH